MERSTGESPSVHTGTEGGLGEEVKESLKGKVKFNLEDFKENLYFNPKRVEEEKFPFDELETLNFTLVDSDGYPTGESPEKDIRQFSQQVLLKNKQGNNNKMVFDQWQEGDLRIIKTDGGRYAIVTEDNVGLAIYDTEDKAQFYINTRTHHKYNHVLDSYTDENLDKSLERVGSSVEVLKDWAMPEPSLEMYDSRIPVNQGEVVIFEDGVAMVAIHWDDSSNNVIWMQDWAAGDKVWMRNVANGYDTKKWKRWEHNYKKNKKYINRGISSLKGSHKGKPALIVGNGPSLLRTAPFIKQHPDLKILTCNRGLNYMEQYNKDNGGSNVVDYYFVADYEGRPEWYEILQRSRADVCCYTFADHGISKYADPNRFYWFILSNFIKEMEVEAQLRWLDWLCSGTSVSTPMLHFAYHVLEADPIILVGFDHAYTMGMKYPDMKLTRQHTSYKKSVDQMYKVTEDIYGGPTLTDPMLELQKLQNDAVPFFHLFDERRFVNATGAGILNPAFWETMSIVDAYDYFVDQTREAPSKNEILHIPEKAPWWVNAKNHLINQTPVKIPGSVFK